VTDDQTPACDLCAVVLVADPDPTGQPVVHHVHAAACPHATPTADIARANT